MISINFRGLIIITIVVSSAHSTGTNSSTATNDVSEAGESSITKLKKILEEKTKELNSVRANLYICTEMEIWEISYYKHVLNDKLYAKRRLWRGLPRITKWMLLLNKSRSMDSLFHRALRCFEKSLIDQGCNTSNSGFLIKKLHFEVNKRLYNYAYEGKGISDEFEESDTAACAKALQSCLGIHKDKEFNSIDWSKPIWMVDTNNSQYRLHDCEDSME